MNSKPLTPRPELEAIFEGKTEQRPAQPLNLFRRPRPLTVQQLYFLLANRPLYCRGQKRGWPTLELTEWELEDLRDELEGDLQ